MANHELVSSETPVNQVTKTCKQLKVWKIAKLEWGKPLELKIAERYPAPPGSMRAIDSSKIPGPKFYPLRPNLAVEASPSGLAGILKDGEGENQPLVVPLDHNSQTIRLPSKPYSVSVRSDGGAWILLGDKLIHYDAQGNALRTVSNPGGGHLIGTEDNSVWVLSIHEAWFIDSAGRVYGQRDWNRWNSSIVLGKDLCGWDWDSKPRQSRLKCLTPAGQERYISLDGLTKLSGKILAVTQNSLLTKGSWIYTYEDRQGSQQLRLDNVGLTAQDEAFVSIDTNDGQADVCLSNGTSHRVFVKYTHPSWDPSPLVPRMSVVAVEGNRTLTYGYDQAIWYKNGLIDQQFKVNDWTYRNDVFPHLWDMLKFTTTFNSTDGTIILSTSGPTGIAIIGLRWKP